MKLLLPLLFVLMLPVLAACNDSDDSDESNSPTDKLEAKAEQARAAYDQECTTEPELTADGLTEPGSVLCYGTKAIVPARGDGGHGRIEITTTAVELPTGPEEEALRGRFEEELDGRADRMRTIYHRIEFTVLDESTPGVLDEFDPTSLESTVVLADGQPKGFVSIDPDDCTASDVEEATEEAADRGTAGEVVVKSCEWSFVPDDAEVIGASYSTLGDADHAEEYDPIIGEPVRWKAPA
ncbi:hypothetical protein ASG90_07060 [Nocardioides sp. Soil797]|nr:hypothetical protein ASG90_07060 [Nocardioides sp. Soil797]